MLESLIIEIAKKAYEVHKEKKEAEQIPFRVKADRSLKDKKFEPEDALLNGVPVTIVLLIVFAIASLILGTILSVDFEEVKIFLLGLAISVNLFIIAAIKYKKGTKLNGNYVNYIRQNKPIK